MSIKDLPLYCLHLSYLNQALVIKLLKILFNSSVSLPSQELGSLCQDDDQVITIIETHGDSSHEAASLAGLYLAQKQYRRTLSGLQIGHHFYNLAAAGTHFSR